MWEIVHLGVERVAGVSQERAGLAFAELAGDRLRFSMAIPDGSAVAGKKLRARGRGHFQPIREITEQRALSGPRARRQHPFLQRERARAEVNDLTLHRLPVCARQFLQGCATTRHRRPDDARGDPIGDQLR